MSPIFGFPSVFQTKSIALNVGTITKATLRINTSSLSDTNDFLYYLSADGGVNWESVTNNTEHTFTNTGQDLRLQIVGNPGAYIRVRQTDGSDYPIKVTYVV